MKAARARQLYLPNNPIYRGAIDALRAAFVPVWKQTPILPLVIDELDIRWEEETVLTDPTGSKSADNLAWLFFKDGVRELTLTPGFEGEEVLKLLDIVQRARRATTDDDDLVAMLWEAEFTFLTYRHLDLLQDGVGSESSLGPEVTPIPAEQVQRETQAAVEESQSAGFVNMADFDSTLYFLDEEEVEYLRREIEREYAHDLRGNVISALFDIFELHADATARGEILDHGHAIARSARRRAACATSPRARQRARASSSVERHQGPRIGAARDAVTPRSRLRRRRDRDDQRLPRHDARSRCVRTSGLGESRRKAVSAVARASANGQLTLPGRRRRAWRLVAPAGQAVLPVADRTPRRCRRRDSFARPLPHPRREARVRTCEYDRAWSV